MSERICVSARIRPIADVDDEVVLRSDANNIQLRIVSAGSLNVKSFRVDNVFTEKASQVDVFSKVLPLLQSAVDGINCTIFAYGQTGTGIIATTF